MPNNQANKPVSNKSENSLGIDNIEIYEGKQQFADKITNRINGDLTINQAAKEFAPIAKTILTVAVNSSLAVSLNALTDELHKHRQASESGSHDSSDGGHHDVIESVDHDFSIFDHSHEEDHNDTSHDNDWTE